MIGYLKTRYDLPPFETVVKNLTAKEIVGKMKDFYVRWEKSGYDDIAPLDFVELMTFYPVSMCKRDMSDTLKMLITLAYFDFKPDPKDKDAIWQGYSYEDLGLIFCRSKASVHDAVKEKGMTAKNIIQVAKDHVCPVCGK